MGTQGWLICMFVFIATINAGNEAPHLIMAAVCASIAILIEKTGHKGSTP